MFGYAVYPKRTSAFVASPEFNLDNYSFANKSFGLSGQSITAPQDIIFNANEDKFYVLNSANETIFQYSVTPGDISTGSFDSKSYDTKNVTNGATAITAPTGFAFNSDGTKLYVCDGGSVAIYQFSLSVAYDISTSSYDSVSFSIAGEDTDAQDIVLKPDGTKFYITGNNTGFLYQYSMSTPFDLATASFDSKSFDISNEEGAPKGITIKSDGTVLFLTGSGGDEVNQYSFGTAHDISTLSFDSKTLDVSSEDTIPNDIAANASGAIFYIAGNQNDTIYQYSV